MKKAIRTRRELSNDHLIKSHQRRNRAARARKAGRGRDERRGGAVINKKQRARPEGAYER